MGSSDGLWDWNLATQEVYFSPRWKSMLGYADEEMPNDLAEWESRLHPDDLDPTLRKVKDYLAGDAPAYEVEFRLRHKDGSYRWILSRGAALWEKPGQPFRFAGSHTDITARKDAQAEMARLNRELVDASRQAGMAEIATGVLHNVGNVLNSVNVSTTLVLERLKKSKASSLGKSVALLREHRGHLGEFLTTDPKGSKLPGFLEALAGHLAGEQAALVQEMQSLQQNVDHIKQIVAMQQAFAKVSGVLEPVSLRSLVEDALQMAATGLQRHQIEIFREFADVPPVLTDRHKVLQILVNLISNAKHALEARPEGRRLTLRVSRDDDQSVRVEVADNGAGIARENLTRIFQHGFTTKKQGHGFGLHSGANAAQELGGSLTAHSDGPGHGASFTLNLPVQPAREALEAA
jgi:PAS domain S-box-containing protein